MAAQPVVDVFEVERRRLEEAAADLRRSLAEREEQLSEQCSRCALEEEKLLRSKYLFEVKETAAAAGHFRARLAKNAFDLEQRETEMKGAEERMEALEEYQSHLGQEEANKSDLQKRIGQLKEKQRISAEHLKCQIRGVIERGQKEEVKLHQQLRLREEDFARNTEACEDANGMTLQEHLAADLKLQLAESQDKVANLEASLESMQKLVLERERKVLDMIETCDEDLKLKARDKDLQDREKLDFSQREVQLKDANLQMKRLEEADVTAANLLMKIRESGRFALCIPQIHTSYA